MPKMNSNGETKITVAILGERIRDVKEDIKDIKDGIKSIQTLLKTEYVTKTEFSPIKKVVYGLVVGVMGYVLKSILSLIGNTPNL